LSVSLTFTEYQVFAAVTTFLQAILPVGTEIVLAQDNRVPEPRGLDWIEMTPILRRRLNTNISTYRDCAFVGSVSGDVLTVSEVLFGFVSVGAPLYGTNVPNGTTILSQTSNAGGPNGNIGTYAISCAPPLPIISRTMYAGIATKQQSTMVTVQLDVHGPRSADNTQIISTLFRDDYGVTLLSDTQLAVAPLYTSEARQSPFINAEAQYENRWTIDLHLQANMLVITPQQFFEKVSVALFLIDLFDH